MWRRAAQAMDSSNVDPQPFAAVASRRYKKRCWLKERGFLRVPRALRISAAQTRTSTATGKQSSPSLRDLRWC